MLKFTTLTLDLLYWMKDRYCATELFMILVKHIYIPMFKYARGWNLVIADCTLLTANTEDGTYGSVLQSSPVVHRINGTTGAISES